MKRPAAKIVGRQHCKACGRWRPVTDFEPLYWTRSYVVSRIHARCSACRGATPEAKGREIRVTRVKPKTTRPLSLKVAKSAKVSATPLYRCTGCERRFEDPMKLREHHSSCRRFIGAKIASALAS
jgi:hypothetical protein